MRFRALIPLSLLVAGSSLATPPNGAVETLSELHAFSGNPLPLRGGASASGARTAPWAYGTSEPSPALREGPPRDERLRSPKGGWAGWGAGEPEKVQIGSVSAKPNVGYYMQPAIHGDQIVFVSQGDLWKVSASGGVAHALTSHTSPASSPAISPDGRYVAFTGTYEGPSDVYVMSIDGGLPIRLTYDGGMTVAGWTPGGKILASTRNESTLPNTQLVEIDPRSRSRFVEPLSQASDGGFDPLGKTLFFTRLPFQGSQTKRYQGGFIQHIWSYTQSEPEAKPLTENFAGTSKDPMVWQDHVYFLSDRDGTMNLWSMDSRGGSLKQITHYAGWDIQSATLDNGKIAFQVQADLHVLDLTKDTDIALSISLDSDFDSSREEWISNPSAYLSSVKVSADGTKVALTARGKVFVAPVDPGRLVTLTRASGARYRDAMFAPDGKWVLALSDQSGENEWWKLPANGIGKPVQITHDSKVLGINGVLSPDGAKLVYGNKNSELWIADVATGKSTLVGTCQYGEYGDFHWSPDSQWVAYVEPTATFERIGLYSLKSGKSTLVTSDRVGSRSPAWSADGKWLFFLSDRTFNSSVGSPWGPRQPEPSFEKQTKIYLLGLVKGLRSPFQPTDELHPAPEAKPTPGPVTVTVDLDNIQSRLWEAPTPAGNYESLSANAQRLFLVNSLNGRIDVQALEISNKSPELKTVFIETGGYELSADGKKILVTRAGRIYVADASGTAMGFDKPLDLSGWNLVINPREEWRQLFVDAWRLHRDFFYDLHMNGIDWKANLAKYLPFVDRVSDRSELNNLIAQMVGELSVLHTFVRGGDIRSSLDHVEPSFLGAELSRDSRAGGYRVDLVYHGEPDYPDSGSPLSKPGVDVSVGDIVESVNGIDVLSSPEIAATLQNQAGHQVLLKVKDGKTAQEREVIVVPMTAAAFANLRYTDWEVSRRLKVEADSAGEIGYVHLRAMGQGDINQFERDFYPNLMKSGLVIDVRHNNGGNIDSWILERLLRKAWFFWQPRVGAPSWNMQWAFRGHIVVLCDERTASDGEAFTEGIKRLGIAKVIGRRTWGGEIWLSSDNVLEDGGIASAAETGVYGLEGKWLIEGHGVDPDIEVDNLPHAAYLGKDAQLDAAIAYLKKQIREKPIKTPPHPAYPNKKFP